MQKQQKIRIFSLAHDLNMESKALIELCHKHGIDVKNQLSTVDLEQRDAIVQLVKRGTASSHAAPAPSSPSVFRGPQQEPPRNIRDLGRARRTPSARGPESVPEQEQAPSPVAERKEQAAAPTPTEPTSTPVVETSAIAEPEAIPETPAARAPESRPAAHTEARPEPRPEVRSEARPEARPEARSEARPEVRPPAAQEPAAREPAHGAEPATPAEPAQPPVRPQEPQAPAAREVPPAQPPAPTPPAPTAPAVPPAAPPASTSAGQPKHPPRPTPPPATPRVPHLPGSPPSLPTGNRGTLRDLSSGGQRGDSGTRRPPRDRTPPLPRTVPPGQPLMGQHPTPNISRRKEEKKPETKGVRKLEDIPNELLNRGGSVDLGEVRKLLDKHHKDAGKPAPGTPVPADEDEEGAARRPKGGAPAGGGGTPGKSRAGEVVGRDQRHRERQKRKQQVPEPEGRGARLTAGVLEAEDEPRRLLHRQKKARRVQPGTAPRKGKITIELPITVRSLSEAIGVRSGALLLKLMGHGAPSTTNINSTLDPELAEMIAVEEGCELEVKRTLDAEETVLKDLDTPDNPEDVVPRAPVVTIMGHVDHGKTSLLDRIRHSEVAKGEAGGITQVIRAWRVEHGGRPVTFIDTPGHEAFTKMRARGANVTDIAVIVVAADDGVMPQTEEAVAHAKAAGVSIVVAINKVDLPNANLRRTEQQLYGLGLIPDNMGGDVPFVHTSAATGAGIDELLDNISVVAELKELKANPSKPGTGLCLEAHLDEAEGVFATLLVRNGTLKRGDIIVCGASYGRVRAMYSDLGRSIQEAGPSIPVRITGLDTVPDADDQFFVVPDLATARDIAEKRKSHAHEAQQSKRAPARLESLLEAKIVELKVILKAEARGSIEAIRAELEKLHHEEVRVRLLHAAIGGITESDVQLALTSPQDTVIVGFNVVADDRAHALAEERGIQIRTYNIIYQLTDDIRAALEGKLKPREEVVQLGRAVVRDTFKISRVGTIAGCYVTQGIIERNAKVRVIRNGVVVYPPADRTAGLESLKRFRDDAKEVREGFECGLKIAGYDDIKVDDVIEAYKIEQIQRTLS